ncbi:DUF502 domain-containing protein [Tepidibacter thalassicus]|uniref:Uncharacterized membrane protein n=1 Tax=Tepidibacter thalassicus DSM 15285 TaxID=1123350 RepID=A0A1M5NNV0_9FIRM|nr:DUF502 domain-containing protein [Tepidibacter thalassicus]SHG91212.1 Uncharacterized membrane protein [Tepidibacter thalassicus DSM 15285]
MKNNSNLKDIRKVFITGIFTILPIAVTISLVFWLFNKIDSIFRGPLERLLGFPLYGVGIIITFLLIFLTGMITTDLLGKKIFQAFENVMYKIPLVGMIYSSVKQVVDAFAAKKGDGFKNTVLVEYPSKGIYTLGFITTNTPKFINENTGAEGVFVFIPTTPNPTSGMLITVPKDEIIYLDVSIENALKIIVSGGIVSPKEN